MLSTLFYRHELKMKFPVVPVFVLIILSCFVSTIWLISSGEKAAQPLTWSFLINFHNDSVKHKNTNNVYRFEADNGASNPYRYEQPSLTHIADSGHSPQCIE